MSITLSGAKLNVMHSKGLSAAVGNAARKLKCAQILLAAEAGASDEAIARGRLGSAARPLPNQTPLGDWQPGGCAQ